MGAESGRLDPSVLDGVVVAQLVDAAAVAREEALSRVAGSRSPAVSDDEVHAIVRADGRLEGLAEALAILVGRPMNELRDEAIARARLRQPQQQHGALLVQEVGECLCYHTCREGSTRERPTGCSLSGDWHQHPDEPCPVHPDAPRTP